MKKILLTIFTILFSSLVFAADEKSGRFFEDQPDVTDDYQIHFNYLLAADSEDREMDINGKMEKILLDLNEAMLKATANNKKGDGVARKYKFDYRADGKIDITFIRLDKKKKELHKWANNDIIPFLNKVKGQKNIKKIYYNFADFSNVDGGEAGVGYGTSYLKSSSMGSDERKLIITLHELLHTQGMGYDCVPGIKSGNGHYSSSKRGYMLESGRKIGSVYAHKTEGCPQMMDTVYLTPTRNDPYDPYKHICLLDLGKYNHPKLLKKLNKIKQKADKQISWKLRYATSCRYRDWNRVKGQKGYYIWGVEDNIAAR
ncbi:hypothetical protein N9D74_01565 [Candidatus Pelagibacter sp.]|jgi:hypothetical protein|nr:hypothetical protein [Candidatus Pelagibacter sp.]MDA9931604.1 hypothetical protein [Candidatus Pelagibacter sp.]|tara:strand:- start:115 stop:1059 length:945 start_codon:yes stop_codon:yes gene_type:complete